MGTFAANVIAPALDTLSAEAYALVACPPMSRATMVI